MKVSHLFKKGALLWVMVPAACQPEIAGPDKGALYLSSPEHNQVVVLETLNYSATRKINLPGAPGQLGINHTTQKLYVSFKDSLGIAIIDIATKQVVANINTVSLNAPIAVDEAADLVYTCNSTTLYQVDGTTGTILATSNSTGGDLIKLNPRTGRLYLYNLIYRTLDIFDSNTMSLVTTVAMPADVAGFVIHPGNNRLYINYNHGGQFGILNGETGAFIKHLQLDHPGGSVALNLSANEVYVAKLYSHLIAIINTRTNQVTGHITTGLYVPGYVSHSVLAVNPYSGKIYTASNSSKNIMTVVDTGIRDMTHYVSRKGPVGDFIVSR